jgi:hypothetical protein
MREIEIRKKATTPDGKYCVDYSANPSVEKCEQLRSTTSYIGWDAGLGSPGSITYYHCALFDESLSKCYPRDDFHGLTVKKCHGCLSA